MNLWADFLGTAEQVADRTALVEGDREVTYAELVSNSGRLAKTVRSATDLGVIGLFLPTCIGFVESFYAVMKAGKAVVPLNLLSPPRTLEYILKDAAIDTIMTSSRFVDDLKPSGARLIVLEEIQDCVRPSEDTRSGGSRDESISDPDALALILYTSGTSGQPKGVRLSHGNILANIRASTECIEVTRDDVFLAMLPLFHTFAITGTMGIPLHSGAQVVLQSMFNPDEALKAVERRRVTVLLAVASMYRLLNKFARIRRYDTSSLRVSISGGEALPPAVESGFSSAFGTELLQGYGLTEAAPVVAVNPPSANRPGTVGPAIPGVEVKVVDEEDHARGPGEIGELCVRGPNVMQGYHNLPEQTAGALDKGWLRTRDMAKIDEDGYITITGRKDEMIIVSGENVFPAEIEIVLDEHPHVAQSAVFGVKDELRGECIKAVVVPAVEDPDKALLREHLARNLAPYKVPKIIEFRRDVPLSATGKVLKRALT